MNISIVRLFSPTPGPAEKHSVMESNQDSIRRANSHVIVNVISMNLPIEGPRSPPLYKRTGRSTVIIRKIHIIQRQWAVCMAFSLDPSKANKATVVILHNPDRNHAKLFTEISKARKFYYFL